MEFKESFLHFLWLHKNFTSASLQVNEAPLLIFDQGTLNHNAGPDFLNARIRLGDMDWYGNIELHRHSSEWYQHGHQHDPAYENVILHVVYTDDRPVKRKDGTLIPTLELKGKIDPEVYQRYKRISGSSADPFCSSFLPDMSPLRKISMIERALVERLEKKSLFVQELYHKNRNDWEETAWQLLARSFGLKVNAEPFLQLAENLPLKVLKKHKFNLCQTEAILFGQGGFLNRELNEEYFLSLKKEYAFLRHKYSLPESLTGIEWKFSRMRPASFPSLRLAQLAAVIHKLPSLFSSLTEVQGQQEAEELLSVQASCYWHSHTWFGRRGRGGKRLGKQGMKTIFLNCIVPLLFAYSRIRDSKEVTYKVLSLLETSGPEHNKITRLWEQYGMENLSGFDSQGLIGLYKDYCLQKNCLNCSIGTAILKGR